MDELKYYFLPKMEEGFVFDGRLQFVLLLITSRFLNTLYF
jgi:hypothetical protein